jgi:hypothetical protein
MVSSGPLPPCELFCGRKMDTATWQLLPLVRLEVVGGLGKLLALPL